MNRGFSPLREGRSLGTSAEMWMNLQKLYELRLEGEQIRKTIRPAVAVAA